MDKVPVEPQRANVGARETPLLLMLGVMGAVSLVYQVTWTRQLTNLLGSTVSAIAIITALFMLGMAVGAWVEGRRSDQVTSPVRTVCLLALALAASGAAGIPLYRWAAAAYAGGAFGSSQAAVSALSVVLAFATTFLPTALVGAAFPVASRALAVGNRNISAGVGSAYVAGTAGSIVGAILAGFVLVPAMGVTATILAAAGFSALAGVAGLLLHRAPEADTGQRIGKADPAPASRHATRLPALVAFTLSGSAVMIYETVWTREILLVFGSSVYAVATMLAAVLTGLAIGQWLGSRNRQDRDSALATIGYLQLSGAGAALISLLLTRAIPLAYVVASTRLHGTVLTFGVVQFLLTFLTIATPCGLLGATAPIATRLITTNRRVLGSDIGVAYSLNTLGAVAGSLAGGLILMPLLSTTGSAAAAAALNATGAVVALRASTQGASRYRYASLAIVVLGIAALLAVDSASPLLNLAVHEGQASSTPAELLSKARETKVLFSKDSPQGRVAVYEAQDGSRGLKASGMTEGAQGFADAQTTELLIRLPVAILGDVSDVLVVGLGTGATSLVTLSAPGEPRVDTVEINPAVIEASRYFVGDALDTSERSRIIVDDARHYFTVSETAYDVIASEPSYPLSGYSARMFTGESFTAARRTLAPGGVMVQWLPAYLMDENDLNMMAKTFATVFPNSHVWVTLGTDELRPWIDCMLVGINGDATIDPDQVNAIVAASGGGSFAFEHVYGPEDTAALVADPSVPLNTDDRPIFEFRTPIMLLRALWN